MLALAHRINGRLRVAALLGGEYIDNQSVVTLVQITTEKLLQRVFDLADVCGGRYLHRHSAHIVCEINSGKIRLLVVQIPQVSPAAQLSQKAAHKVLGNLMRIKLPHRTGGFDFMPELRDQFAEFVLQIKDLHLSSPRSSLSQAARISRRVRYSSNSFCSLFLSTRKVSLG